LADDRPGVRSLTMQSVPKNAAAERNFERAAAAVAALFYDAEGGVFVLDDLEERIAAVLRECFGGEGGDDA
jgi:hypothetical protein